MDDRVYEKVYGAVKDFIGEISTDPNHRLRSDFEQRALKMRDDLSTNPKLMSQAEEWKRRIVEHPEVNAWVDTLWARVKEKMLEQMDEPESNTRKYIASAAQAAGRNLADDPTMQAKVNGWVIEAAGYAATEFKDEVSGLISSTVKSWDADETAARLEAQVGRDLQFIRINGTIVGGLVGLTIYTVSQLF